MDAPLAEYIDKYQAAQLSSHQAESDSESLSGLLDALENDDAISAQYKENRLQQLQKEIGAIDRAAASRGLSLGAVHTVSDEKELMSIVTRTEILVVHFFQPAFARCRAMNDALAELAQRHVAVHVLAVQADLAPFLVAKLAIKVLPFVVVYKKGVEITRIVGFEGVADAEGRLATSLLENRLVSCGAILRVSTTVISKKAVVAQEDLDDDWY